MTPKARQMSGRLTLKKTAARPRYYWDGLDDQREAIRLTVRPNAEGVALPDPNDERELIPPLDLVLRTKWPGCVVDWNGSEPIL